MNCNLRLIGLLVVCIVVSGSYLLGCVDDGESSVDSSSQVSQMLEGPSSEVDDCKEDPDCVYLAAEDLITWQDSLKKWKGNPPWRDISEKDGEVQITFEPEALNIGLIPTAAGQGYYDSDKHFFKVFSSLLGIEIVKGDEVDVSLIQTGESAKIASFDSEKILPSSSGDFLRDALTNEDGEIYIDKKLIEFPDPEKTSADDSDDESIAIDESDDEPVAIDESDDESVTIDDSDDESVAIDDSDDEFVVIDESEDEFVVIDDSTDDTFSPMSSETLTSDVKSFFAWYGFATFGLIPGYGSKLYRFRVDGKFGYWERVGPFWSPVWIYRRHKARMNLVQKFSGGVGSDYIQALDQDIQRNDVHSLRAVRISPWRNLSGVCGAGMARRGSNSSGVKRDSYGQTGNIICP